ncbi:MAG: hypothetical protein HFF84_05915 [Oscillibacter sp.]|nr:hypothetical protein [Oscillibacter sp.]
MKKYLAFLLAITMLASLLTGCGGDTNSGSGSDSGSQNEDSPPVEMTGNCTVPANSDIVVINYSDISTFFPADVTQASEYSLGHLAYESLCTFDDDMNIQYVLASGCEVSEDGKDYTFTLRKGIKFSDGEDWNAEACKANFDMILDESNAFLNVWMITDVVESCEVVDDYTVMLHLFDAYAPMLNVLASFTGFVSPALIAKGPEAWKNEVVGTGQYVQTEYRSGESAVYTLNRNYWGYDPEIAGDAVLAPDAGFNSITVKPVSEEATRIAMLISGEADIIGSVSATNIPTLEANGGTITKCVGALIAYLYFNCQKPATSDVRVRQAISLAIDTAALNDVVYGGANQVCDSVLSPSISGYKSSGIIETNLEKARELLAEAGYGDGLTLVAWEENDTSDIQRGEFIQQQLEQIGITLQIQPMEGGVLATEIGGHEPSDPNYYDLYIRGYGSDTYDSDEMLGRFSTPAWAPVGSNYTYYSNAEYDALIAEAAKTIDPDVRNELYSQAQDILREDMPVLPLLVNSYISAYGKRIENFNYHTNSFYNYNDATFVG